MCIQLIYVKVASDLFFCIVMYIWVKHFQKWKCKMRFYPSVVDCMEADLNANLSLIVRNWQDSSGQVEKSSIHRQRKVCHINGIKILIKNYKLTIKKKDKKERKKKWMNLSQWNQDAFRKKTEFTINANFNLLHGFFLKKQGISQPWAISQGDSQQLLGKLYSGQWFQEDP